MTRILILEDDLLTLATIYRVLQEVEEETGEELYVTGYSSYLDVIPLNTAKVKFDIILLDRDSVEGGNFHSLDVEKFGGENIIAISTSHAYNEEAIERGVTMVIAKDALDLDDFGNRLKKEIIRRIKNE